VDASRHASLSPATTTGANALLSIKAQAGGGNMQNSSSSRTIVSYLPNADTLLIVIQTEMKAWPMIAVALPFIV
jgi:hypothetical protein